MRSLGTGRSRPCPSCGPKVSELIQKASLLPHPRDSCQTVATPCAQGMLRSRTSRRPRHPHRRPCRWSGRCSPSSVCVGRRRPSPANEGTPPTPWASTSRPQRTAFADLLGAARGRFGSRRSGCAAPRDRARRPFSRLNVVALRPHSHGRTGRRRRHGVRAGVRRQGSSGRLSGRPGKEARGVQGQASGAVRKLDRAPGRVGTPPRRPGGPATRWPETFDLSGEPYGRRLCEDVRAGTRPHRIPLTCSVPHDCVTWAPARGSSAAASRAVVLLADQRGPDDLAVPPATEKARVRSDAPSTPLTAPLRPQRRPSPELLRRYGHARRTPAHNAACPPRPPARTGPRGRYAPRSCTVARHRPSQTES
jgi:hypothetical protein